MKRLQDKVAVVTGAGSGIGRATALLFAAEGARVVLADISGNQDAVAAQIGEAAIGVHCDVASEDDIRAMIGAARAKFGRVDILVNNAGFGGATRPLHLQSSADWDRIHAVNIRGVFLGMKYAIASMLETGGGSIVNITSISAMVGWKNHSIYGAAKAASVQLIKAAALDYAAHNIRINGVSPGTIWTGLNPQSLEFPEPPPGVGRLPGIPMDRWGLASEIAEAVLFLASDAASYVTGQVLGVDGGYSIGFSGLGAEISGAAKA